MNAIFVLILFILAILFVTKKRNRRFRIRELFLPIYSYLTAANDRLYRLISTVQSLLDKHEIPWSITGPVLLAAVERQQLTRGQATATILVPQTAIPKILDLNDYFSKYGLGLSDMPDGGYRLSGAMALPFISDVAVLIYPVIHAGDRWITESKYLGYDEWYGADELFPTKMYQLGMLNVPGPRNPINYLRRNYWSLGLGATELIGVPKKKWFNISPRFYGSNLIGPITRVDEINGIDLDPRPIPVLGGKQTVLMGNGRAIMVPQVGSVTPLVNKGPWRRYSYVS